MFHKTTILSFSGASLLVLLVVGIAFAQNETRKTPAHPGLEPYTPSKTEWMALKLQSYYGSTSFDGNRYRLTYLRSGPETITIVVHYLTGVDRELMNKEVESALRISRAEGRANNWDWIEIKEKYEKIDAPAK